MCWRTLCSMTMVLKRTPAQNRYHLKQCTAGVDPVEGRWRHGVAVFTATTKVKFFFLNSHQQCCVDSWGTHKVLAQSFECSFFETPGTAWTLVIFDPWLDILSSLRSILTRASRGLCTGFQMRSTYWRWISRSTSVSGMLGHGAITRQLGGDAEATAQRNWFASLSQLHGAYTCMHLKRTYTK